MNRNHVVQVTIKVLDRATDPLKKLHNQTKQMATSLNGAGTSLGAFSNKMGSVAKGIDSAANSMNKFNTLTSNAQRNLKLLGTLGAAATAAMAVNAANQAIDFEFKTVKMQTKMEANSTTRKDIESYILNDLSTHSSFKPTEIADLGIVLGQGGVNSKQDMKDLLKSTTYFAEAVDADPALAGKMLISAVKGFDLKMSNSGEVTDKLAVALNKSLLEVDELPHAIGELAGRAKMLGQSFDSSLVALMMGKDQGMNAAQTSQDFLHGLRQLSQIGNTDFMTPKRMEYFEKAGIDTSFFDKDKLQLKEFPEIIASLEKTLTNQGLMPNREHFYEVIAKNGGSIPDGLINKMAAMPMISKIFGAAGQAPLIMGLQSKYEEVNQETGEKTGVVHYGSDALKRMQKDLKNSQGAVQKVHDELGMTAKYMLDNLSSVWQAAKIKVTDDFLPVIKATTKELNSYISGKGTAGALDRLDASISKTAASLKKTNPELGEFVEGLGHTATNAVRVSSTVPSTLKQIGKAANDNLVNGDWGSSLATIPFYAVKNGTEFISDTLNGNPEFDKKVAELPPELQDTAKLTRGIIQGGVILVAAGAIVKIIEMAFRSASLLIKGGKIGFDVSKWLLDIMSGGKAGKGKGIGEATATMAINANIVNVYGKAINNMPGSGGSQGAPGGAPTPVPSNGGNKVGKIGFIGVAIPVIAAGTAGAFLSSRAREMSAESTKDMEESYANGQKRLPQNTQKSTLNVGSGNYKDMGPYAGPAMKDMMFSNNQSVIKASAETSNQISNYLSNIGRENSAALTTGFNTVNNSLQNVKVDNKINITPSYILSGELKESMKNVTVTPINGGGYNSFMEEVQARRFNR